MQEAICVIQQVCHSHTIIAFKLSAPQLTSLQWRAYVQSLPRQLEISAMAALPDENARLSPAVEEAEWPHSPTPNTKAKADEQSPFPPTQKAPPTPNSSPTQGSGQGSPAAEGPALASSHWGFNIKRAKVPGQGAGAAEPVQSSLADLRTCAAYTFAASGFVFRVSLVWLCVSRSQDAQQAWTR